MAGAMTRHQMTQERIMDNIEYCNKPVFDVGMKVLMVGQQMETQSILSERRPISRKVYRSKGTMPSVDGDPKAMSELQGHLSNFISSS